MTIRYAFGDATMPEPLAGLRVICHVCNDRGVWGAGFVVAISKRWPEPEREYRRRASKAVLGEVQFCQAEPGIVVANMIAQHGLPTLARRVVIDYHALEICLAEVRLFCAGQVVSIHMPRIGCGIAGGDWTLVSAIIERRLPALAVTVYDLPQGRGWRG